MFSILGGAYLNLLVQGGQPYKAVPFGKTSLGKECYFEGVEEGG